MEDGLPVFPQRICLVVMTKGTPRSVLQGAPSFLTFLNVRSSPEGKAVTDPLHSFHFAAPLHCPPGVLDHVGYDHCSHCRGCEILDLQLAIPLLFLLRPPTSPPSSSHPPAHDPNPRPTPWLSASSPSRPSSSSSSSSPSSLLLLGRQDWCPSIPGRSYLEKYILHFPSPTRRAPQIASPSPSHHAARHTIKLAALSGCILSFQELSRAPLELPSPPPPGSRARHAVLQPLQHGDRETLVQSLRDSVCGASQIPSLSWRRITDTAPRLENDFIVFRGHEHESAAQLLKGTVVLCLPTALKVEDVHLRLTGTLHYW